LKKEYWSISSPSVILTEECRHLTFETQNKNYQRKVRFLYFVVNLFMFVCLLLEWLKFEHFDLILVDKKTLFRQWFGSFWFVFFRDITFNWPQNIALFRYSASVLPRIYQTNWLEVTFWWNRNSWLETFKYC
jgi:hypothetical protein